MKPHKNYLSNDIKYIYIYIHAVWTERKKALFKCYCLKVSQKNSSMEKLDTFLIQKSRDKVNNITVSYRNYSWSKLVEECGIRSHLAVRWIHNDRLKQTELIENVFLLPDFCLVWSFLSTSSWSLIYKFILRIFSYLVC